MLPVWAYVRSDHEWAGRDHVLLEEMISHRFDFTEINEAFRVLASSEALRVVLDMPRASTAS